MWPIDASEHNRIDAKLIARIYCAKVWWGASRVTKAAGVPQAVGVSRTARPIGPFTAQETERVHHTNARWLQFGLSAYGVESSSAEPDGSEVFQIWAVVDGTRAFVA